MMRFSEATGHKVVSTATADTVGRVAGFTVDPQSRAVVALELKKTASGRVLRWSDLLAFGADAVTVSGADKITEPDEPITALTGKAHHLVGKRLLSSAGDVLGKVDDVEFDPETGMVTSLLANGAGLDGRRLIGVGSYAVVVQADAPAQSPPDQPRAAAQAPAPPTPQAQPHAPAQAPAPPTPPTSAPVTQDPAQPGSPAPEWVANVTKDRPGPA